MKAKIKVLVVDDSALVRALLSQMVNSDSRLEVVATASDPYEARELIKKHSPDVLTLDIEMPKMNGISFLKNLMRLRPMPAVMITPLVVCRATCDRRCSCARFCTSNPLSRSARTSRI